MLLTDSNFSLNNYLVTTPQPYKMSISLVYVVLMLTVLVLITIYLRRKRSYWSRKGVYSNPKSWIFGDCKDVLLMKHTAAINFASFYEEIKKRNLKFGGYYVFFKPIFVPVDLDLIKRMLTTDFAHFNDRAIHCDEQSAPLSATLFGLKGDQWKSMRTKITPFFTAGKMKMMFPTLLETSKELTCYLDKLMIKNEVINIRDLTARFTMDVIISCAFGLDAKCLKEFNPDFLKYGLKFLEPTIVDYILRFLAIFNPEILTYFKIDPTRKEISDFFTNAAKSTVEYREKNGIIRPDFMHLMIQSKNNVEINDKNDKISLSQIVAQAWTIYLAGFETSATTSTFCLFELAQHLDIQDKLRNEIKDILRKYHGNITYEGLQEMTFMEMTINETLRKYPPVPGHSRVCTKDYKVPETEITIPKGCMVIIPSYAIQNDREIYPDPEKFDPERFTSENISKRHPASWTPFGDGPRVCIGVRFGMIETKIALTTLLRSYKFSLNSRTKVPLRFEPTGFILAAQGSIWLNAEKIL